VTGAAGPTCSGAWRSEIQRRRDGIVADTIGVSGLERILAKMGPEPSEETSNKFWLSNTEEKQIPTAAALGVIAVSDERDDARGWQRGGSGRGCTCGRRARGSQCTR
jgi:hypothetical protein